MATVLPKVILLRGRGRRREAEAGGAITPGMLVQYNAAGQLIVHNVAGGVARPIYAVENDLVGLDIDTPYNTGDYVQSEELDNGCDVYGIIAAGAPAVNRGDKLESAGNGTVRKLTTGVPIAECIAAVDNSAGAAAARIKIAIMP